MRTSRLPTFANAKNSQESMMHGRCDICPAISELRHYKELYLCMACYDRKVDEDITPPVIKKFDNAEKFLNDVGIKK